MQQYERDPYLKAAYQFALAEFGEREVAGSDSNPRILQYLNTTTLSPVKNDEVHWCSAFINWCLIEATVTPTYSARARSWEVWGQEVIDTPQQGDIVLLSRTSNPALGHVGFYHWAGGDQIALLGGNHKNSVNITTFASSRIVTIRTLYRDIA